MSGTRGRCCPVVELRQYTLKPGRRDDLIELFERHFIESQEALGMTVIGQFRDRRRPDRFVWLRGFADMETRRGALEAFYGGPVWAEHGDAANDTMLAWDDVLLLRPGRADTSFRLDAATGRAVTILAGIHEIPERDPATIAERERRIVSALEDEGLRLEGLFVTETAQNTFPRLPVRGGESVLVWFATVAEGDRSEDALDRLARRASIAEHPPKLLVLDPTPRSLLGGDRRRGDRTASVDSMMGTRDL